ncbi:MAG: hypothetical protein IPK79_04775 [Vampirovibrionales bacterium]|nr:hypothetical protein [Vampirovibrionales bacterium]
MWANAPSYRYAPFFMALLGNLGLFSTLMDALYADSEQKVRAWASYFNRFWFPVLMERVMRRKTPPETVSGAHSADGPDLNPVESALALVDHLIAMLQAPVEARSRASQHLQSSADAPDAFDAPALDYRPRRRAFQDVGDGLLCASWGEPTPNPRAERGKSPHFPRQRLLELLQRQRILLSNPAWGRPNYTGWWQDPAIAPERLDDIARALQPRPTPTLLSALTRAAGPPPPDTPSPDLAPAENPGIRRLSGVSDRDRRLLSQLKREVNPSESRPEPRRFGDDARHPP